MSAGSELANPARATRDQRPPDAKQDQRPPDAQQDQRPPDAKQDQRPPDARARERLFALDPQAQDLLFRDARSATEFTDEPVTDEHLRAIYDLARYAPTSLNQQPLRMVAVRDGAVKQRLLPCLTGRNASRAARAPLVLVLAADIDFHERLPEVFPHAPGLREELDPRAAERAEQARFNATLQIGFLIVAIRAAGFGAGPMIGFDAAAVDRIFFPDGRRQTLLVCMVGRPLPKAYPRLPRLSYHDVITTR